MFADHILEKLLFPISIEDFFSNYWEQKFIHIQRNNPEYFTDILGITDLDDFLSQQNLSTEGLRIVKDGKDVNPEEWTITNKLISGKTRTAIAIDKVFDFYDNGHTIVLNAADRTIPRLADACRAFEQILKIKVQSNIYITPPNSQGFSQHYDPHDIFTLQIKGPKIWRIYDSDEELPTKYSSFKKKPVLVSQIEMNSGDLLYMPRGTIHEAFSSDVSTIGANFSCKPRYGAHLLEQLAIIAEQEEVFFRKTIPNGLQSVNDQKQYIADFKKKLIQFLTDDVVERLLNAQYMDFYTKQTINYHGKFTELLHLEDITLNTVLRRNKGITYHVENIGNQVIISFSSKKLIIPLVINKELFLQDEPFKISDIKGLISNNGKLEIARKFVVAGYFDIVSY